MNIPVVEPMNNLSLNGKMVSIPQGRLSLLVNVGFSGVEIENTFRSDVLTVYSIEPVIVNLAIDPPTPEGTIAVGAAAMD